jgi:hypothetical protein
MAGLRDKDEELKREEDRLGRNIEKRTVFDRKPSPTPPPKEEETSSPNTQLHFVLKGLPAEPGSPVQVLVNDDPVYSSEQFNGDLTATFSAPIRKGFGNQVNISLKIPAMGFENSKKFSLNDGFYFKFEATAKGLSILHQTKPF